MASCKVLTIANDNEKYKTHMFVILFIHYSCFSALIFVYSLCFYLDILQHNGGFDSHMYISLYIFTAHLLYNHCILLRCIYYIVFTYVDFIVSYYFFISDHELITLSFHSIK